jgi:hypothetical protein
MKALKEILNINHLLPPDTFEKIKHFILQEGGRKTYRNFDNNNPHYQFSDFSVYLGADIGQQNIINDPAISDFNEITIQDWNSDITYYHIIIVRNGDIENGKAWIRKGMENNNVYLSDVYNQGIDKMMEKLPYYVEIIEKEINQLN